jgi:hypothetical protein
MPARKRAMATLEQQWLEDLRHACVESSAPGDGVGLGDAIGSGQPPLPDEEIEGLAYSEPAEDATGLRPILGDEHPVWEAEAFRDGGREGVVLPRKRKGPLRPKAPPEEGELKRKRAKFSEFQSQLADKELSLTNLQAELSSIKARYLKGVGARYARLDEIQARIAELHAASRPLDSEMQKAARRARRQADRSRAAVEQNAAPAPPVASAALKRLYRDVAKRIHPDLGVDPVDRAVRARLMAEANRAFQHGNESRLRAVVEDYECSPETVAGEGTAAELVRIIRKTARVRSRLADIDRGLQQILRSDLYKLKVRVDAKAEQGSDLLEEMAARVDERIARARRRLADLADEVGPL